MGTWVFGSIRMWMSTSDSLSGTLQSGRAQWWDTQVVEGKVTDWSVKTEESKGKHWNIDDLGVAFWRRVKQREIWQNAQHWVIYKENNFISHNSDDWGAKYQNMRRISSEASLFIGLSSPTPLWHYEAELFHSSHCSKDLVSQCCLLWVYVRWWQEDTIQSVHIDQGTLSIQVRGQPPAWWFSQ